MSRNADRSRKTISGFSLLELLVASTVLVLILAIVMGMMSTISSIWRRQHGQSKAFEAANAAYETLTRSLAQATLATHWGYVLDNNGHPVGFERTSELHFKMGRTADLLGLSGVDYPGMALFFQAPEGRTLKTDLKRLPLLLNGLGFFTAFGDAPNVPGFLQSILPSRYRFRLMEWREPVEDLEVYKNRSGDDWFVSRVVSSGKLQNTAVLAENIVALILLAEFPGENGTPERSYIYDSRDSSRTLQVHQLPPRIHVVMMAITESSADRLAQQHGSTAPPLQPRNDLFMEPEKFETDVGAWETDVQTLSPPVEYLVFHSVVHLKNAKWSR